MNAAVSPDDDESDVVTLDFRIEFHKTESVLAPDGTSHGVTAICLKKNYKKILELKPFKAHGEHKPLLEQRLEYIRTSSDHRALLAVALALFDAQFARTAAEPLRPRLPPPPPPDAAC